MKIVFFAKYIDDYKFDLQAKLEKKNIENYAEIITLINDEHFLMINSFYNHLKKIPGVEVYLIIPNWEWLSQKWAKENNISKDLTAIEIAKLQIKKTQPDILFLNSNFEYYTNFIEEIKPDIKNVCAWISCPLPNDEKFKYLDHIFTIFPPHYEYFKKIGKSSTLMNAGFDSDLLKKLNTSKNIDVSFVGGIGTLHKKRIEYLRYLVKKTPIQLWGYGFTSENAVKNIIKKKILISSLSKKYNEKAYGMEMFEILSASKITFNCHGDIAANHSVNIRLFEATGVGTLLITEFTPSINDLFIPGKEIVCYKSKEEAADLINYYLKNEKEREAIAKAGQERTLQNYSYESITKKLYEKFQAIVNEK